MTFRFSERPNSRSSSSNPPAITYEYYASGETSQAVVKAYALSATAGTVVTAEGFLHRQDIKIEPQGYDTWYITVPYGPSKLEPGQYTLNFDTTGGTVHLTTSKETIDSFASAGNAPDHKQLIGVNGDDVEGVDAIIPALKIDVRFQHPYGSVSIPYIKQLASYTGMVNSASFLTFAAGEVLFLGATGSQGSEAEVEVSYSFACSQNATGLTIGDIADIAKKGHEYLWIKYKDAVSENKGIKQPEFAYVERIYDTINLAAVLGFG